MKQYFFVSALSLLSAAFAGQAFAQTVSRDSFTEPRTLLNSRHLGIYIAPEFQYGQLSHDFTPIGSFSLMFIFDQRFAIGANYGMSAATGLDATQGMQMNSSFGGLKIEYTFAPFRAVHLTLPVLIGGQMVQVNSIGSGSFSNDHSSMSGHGNGFAFVQPGLTLEATLTKFVKTYFGASYRAALNAPDMYSDGSESVKFGNSQASGAAFSIGLKLGWFDVKVK